MNAAIALPRRRLRGIVLLIPLLAVALLATGCAPSSAAAGNQIVTTEDTVIIDVRTPGEFADGHLEGAVNIDLSAADFAARVDELDRDVDYVLYCRSGNRSGQALAIMEQAGFVSLVNAGGVDAASQATGIPVVR